MTFMYLIGAFAVLAVFMSADATPPRPPAAVSDPSFKAFLTEFEKGTTRFINGDNALWLQNASHRDDVTLMGGWGAYKVGWTDVKERYDWAAARFIDSGTTLEVEYLSSGVSGDLAYTVAIEQSASHVIGQNAPARMPLRVTHLFRKEDGNWKLIHRQADPLVDELAPGQC